MFSTDRSGLCFRTRGKRRITTILLILFTGCFASHAGAQPAAEKETPTPFWFVASTGWATPSHVGGGSAFSLHVGHRPAFRFGVSINQRFSLFSSPPITGALNSGIGRRLHFGRLSQSAFFVGPAVVVAEHLQSGSGKRIHLTGGVVGSFQAFVKPLAAWGLGIELYGNVNPIRSYAGIRIGILIGNKR